MVVAYQSVSICHFDALSGDKIAEIMSRSGSRLVRPSPASLTVDLLNISHPEDGREDEGRYPAYLHISMALYLASVTFDSFLEP